MLERMSGPLCEAVLDQPGAGVVLAELARSNLLLVPLDRRGQWYRYHHLFRDMLLAELERLEPGLIPVLRRRAAGWCQGNGQPEEALEYSIAAGDVEAAARLMEELYLPVYRQGRIAVRIGRESSAPDVLVRALCQRSLVAMERDRWSQAEAFADQARSVLRRAGIEKFSLLCAVQARCALHRGDAAAARQELVSVQELRPSLTYAFPHLAIQVRIELIRVYLALADLAGARTLMREVDELLRRRPGMGILVGQAEALRVQLSRQRGGASPGPSALTAAELRVLPLLATHLTAAEIAAELFVSLHTVKSQQASLYRKLGTSSRGQAVTRARQLGLLEG